MDHHFDKETANKTPFIRKNDGRILISQIYVDDIIFGSTCEDFSHGFSHTMKSEFEINIEGEL